MIWLVNMITLNTTLLHLTFLYFTLKYYYFWILQFRPCKQIAPEFEKLAGIHKGTACLIKVDVDEAADIASEYNIEAMPTFIAIKVTTLLHVLCISHSPLKDYTKHTNDHCTGNQNEPNRCITNYLLFFYSCLLFVVAL